MDDIVKQARDHAAGMGWRSMDSAPKDGQRVDLAMFTKTGRWIRAPECYWHRKAERWISQWHDKDGYSSLRQPFVPTHWKPLDTPNTPGPTAALLTRLADEVERLREALAEIEDASTDMRLVSRRQTMEHIARRALAGEQGDG